MLEGVLDGLFGGTIIDSIARSGEQNTRKRVESVQRTDMDMDMAYGTSLERKQHGSWSKVGTLVDCQKRMLN